MSTVGERVDQGGADSADDATASGSSASDALDDQIPALDAQRREVLAGLEATPKTIHPKFFYDERGSQLFDAICELPEYYPTRTELAILRDHAGEMAAALGPDVLLVELGSGSSLKTPLLLAELESPAAYVPVDISAEHLEKSAAALSAQFPDLLVLPVAADYTRWFDVPEIGARRRVVYYPGSTIGNFAPEAIPPFLQRMADFAGPGGGLLIGVDLRKDPAELERAYDDAQGVTADFNLNLLDRFNRELGSDFDRHAFRHEAVWNDEAGRIEMYLVSAESQRVTLAGRTLHFAAGERVLTEYSHKFTLDGFATLAAAAGWRVETVWTDPARRFSVQLLVTEPAPDATA